MASGSKVWVYKGPLTRNLSSAEDVVRKSVLILHRLVGLATAAFLVLLGLTGSILVWEEELDALLSPELLKNASAADPLPVPQLIERLDKALTAHNTDGGLHFPYALNFLVFPRDPERSAIAYVSNVRDLAGASGQINQVLVDRNDGRLLGARNTIEPDPFKRQELVPWLYRFHYSLSVGNTGMLLLGVVALAWLLDSLMAWYLTLPRRFSWQNWGSAWRIARRRLTIDLHRASGLWLTPVFVVIAFTGIYFNLYYQVFVPVVNTFSSLTPQPYEEKPSGEPVAAPQIDYEQALTISRAELQQRGRQVDELDYISWNAALGYYVAAYYTDRDLSRDTPSGHVYLNGDGSLRHVRVVGEGSAGDLLLDWQFPLHSGQAFGLPGRLLICISGIVLAVLSITGVVIWWRKLKARSGTSYLRAGSLMFRGRRDG
ncbi:MAG: PepSY-associated TM helix domain-containing protein [Pseudomonadota bacterium]